MNVFDRNSIGGRIGAMINDEAHFNAIADATVGANALHKIINGEKYPTVVQLAMISQALDVSTDYLLFGNNTEEPADEPVYINAPAALVEAAKALAEAEGEVEVVCIPAVMAEAVLKMLNPETAAEATTETQITVDEIMFAHDVVEGANEFEADVTLNINTCANCDECECEECDCSECGCDCDECEDEADEEDSDIGNCHGCDMFNVCFGMTEEEYTKKEQMQKEKAQETNRKIFFESPFEYMIVRALMRDMFGF